jgi:hypothetical protein
MDATSPVRRHPGRPRHRPCRVDRADAELEARLGLDAIAARRREIALERERKAANRVIGPQANRWFIN